MKLKALMILVIIIVSLLPVYLIYKHLQRVMQPRASGRKFLLWLLTVLSIIFVYTFLLVLTIRLLFPGA
ncbi:MAG: hypothetical protein ACT4OJ_03910 [Bacteroidota bacterium]